mmetsp:Transcript_12782/g.54691  ORF Transcript_12782/g.54691 Transcript_12782/m.54691 type:complete len:319 (+) Transcript_12782:478-1434(+)
MNYTPKEKALEYTSDPPPDGVQLLLHRAARVQAVQKALFVLREPPHAPDGLALKRRRFRQRRELGRGRRRHRRGVRVRHDHVAGDVQVQTRGVVLVGNEKHAGRVFLLRLEPRDGQRARSRVPEKRQDVVRAERVTRRRRRRRRRRARGDGVGPLRENDDLIVGARAKNARHGGHQRRSLRARRYRRRRRRRRGVVLSSVAVGARRGFLFGGVVRAPPPAVFAVREGAHVLPARRRAAQRAVHDARVRVTDASRGREEQLRDARGVKRVRAPKHGDCFPAQALEAHRALGGFVAQRGGGGGDERQVAPTAVERRVDGV